MNKHNRFTKKLLSLFLALLILCTAAEPALLTVHAEEQVYKTVTLNLNSDESQSDTITMYYLGDTPFIAIDDLCTLTRSQKSIDGNTITVSHGVLTECVFDTQKGTFTDHLQSVNLTILPLPNGDFAVPAIAFLNYYQATAWISDNTLYSRMPYATVWEILNINLDQSLIDLAGLYGGEVSALIQTALNVAELFILGKSMDWTKYMDTAISYTLAVDVFKYEAVQAYIENCSRTLNEGMDSKEGEDFLSALEDAWPLTKEPIKCFISAYYNPIINDLAADANAAISSNKRFEYYDCLAEAHRTISQKENIKDNVDSLFLYADWLSVGLSAITDTFQVADQHKETDNIIYEVLGTQNLSKLGLQETLQDWGTRADTHQNVSSITIDQLNKSTFEFFHGTVENLKEEFVNALTASVEPKIPYGTLAIYGLNLSQFIAGLIPPAKAAEEDINLVNLASLQEACANVLVATAEQYNSSHPKDLSLYCEYIKALRLYLRASIAVYDRFAKYIENYADEHSDTKALFIEKANQYAVYLYQLNKLPVDQPELYKTIDLSKYPLIPITNERKIAQVEIYQNGNLCTLDRYTYNENGLLKQIKTDRYPVDVVNNPGTVTSLAYDSRHHLISKSSSDGYEETYTYNDYGLVSTHRIKNGISTTYHYDTAGKLTKAFNTLPNGSKSETRYVYNEHNQLTDTYTDDSYGTDHWTFCYDANNRIKETTYSRAYSETFTIAYNYDHKPFTVTLTPILGEELPEIEAYLTDNLGHKLYGYRFSDPEYTTDIHGYLTEVTDNTTGLVYRIRYADDEDTSQEDSESIYSSVLDEYRQAAVMDDNAYLNDPNKFPNVTSVVMKHFHTSHEGNFAYSFIDIDYNGTSELLIGYQAPYGYTLIDVYSHDGASPVKLFYDSSIGERSNLAIYTDGTIRLYGSYGAGSSITNFYRLDESGTSLNTVKSYSISPDIGGTPYYETAEYQDFISRLAPISAPTWTPLAAADADSLALYTPVLDRYREALVHCKQFSDRWDIDESDSSFADINLSIPASTIGQYPLSSQMAYAPYDINGDGDHELLVGVAGNSSLIIGDIWTLKNDTPTQVLKLDDFGFTYLYLFPDSVIHTHSEGMGSVNQYFKFHTNGDLEYLGGIVHDITGVSYAIDANYAPIAVEDLDALQQKLNALNNYEDCWNGSWTILS